jgi:hypothetical protein
VRVTERTCRRAVLATYTLVAIGCVLQRGVLGPQHNVFKIFRRSFWHLVAGQNIYAAFPAEQGGAPADLFKYSPTAALLFAPIAIPPYTWALLAWSLLGALLLYHALTLVLEPRRALIASVVVLPDVVAALQSCSSNAQIAALIIIAFAALERGRQIRGAAAIVAGAAMKIFPLAAVTFAIFHPRRWRFALVMLTVSVLALLLPLLVTSPSALLQQYRWWSIVERSDAADLAFGLSAMHLVRQWFGGAWPNWPVQLGATVALLLPVLLRRREWQEPEFRLTYLASLLMFAVLFNHQAERQSFVIASAGVAIWCVTPPRGTSALWPRAILALSAVVGLKTLPLLLVWMVAQLELHGWRARWPERSALAPNRRPASLAVEDA